MMEFQNILKEHAARYPLMEPQDYGKLAYQSEYGPMHLVLEEKDAARAIFAELENRSGAAGAVSFGAERIGNGLCRFHFSNTENPDDLVPVLAKLFCLTARKHHGTREGLDKKLRVLERLDMPGMREWLEDYREKGCPAVHHSDRYREAYHPRYRLLKTEYAAYLPALLKIRELSGKKETSIVAIDGRCGSGKTRMAETIAEVFPCNVFHMDDYYLPMEERSDNWQETAGANMDFSRFAEEVLTPVSRGTEVIMRPYDCASGGYRPEQRIAPKPLNIVEGSYSCFPELTQHYDLTVFLSCSKETQEKRLKDREGDYYSVFAKRWIPLEEQYFLKYNIQKQADLLIDTTE